MFDYFTFFSYKQLISIYYCLTPSLTVYQTTPRKSGFFLHKSKLFMILEYYIESRVRNILIFFSRQTITSWKVTVPFAYIPCKK